MAFLSGLTNGLGFRTESGHVRQTRMTLYYGTRLTVNGKVEYFSPHMSTTSEDSLPQTIMIFGASGDD